MKTVLHHAAVRRSMAIAIRRALWSGAVVALAGTASVQAQEATAAQAAAPAEQATTLDTVSVLGTRLMKSSRWAGLSSGWKKLSR